MSAALEIVRAGPGDIDAIAALADAAIPAAWSRAALADELVRPHAEVWLARRGAAPLGFAISWVVADEASVLLIAVDPSVQRAGLGRRLLRQVERSAAARGAATAHLEVRRKNAGARAFYAAMGYREVGARARYYADDGDDAVLMSRGLGDGTDLVILAGGAGRRMGGALKATLRRPDGQTILEALAGTLGPVVDETWLVAPPPLLPRLDPTGRFAHVADQGRGPAEALTAVGPVSVARWLLLVGGDQPRPSRDLLRRLIARATPDIDAVAVQTPDGGVQPLWALYRRAALLALEAPRSLKGILEQRPCALVGADELGPDELAALGDADTPEDAEALGLARD